MSRFVRACATEMHMDMSQEQFLRKSTRKMPRPSGPLCEPARPKCAWTQKFTGKMPDAPAEDTVSCEPAQWKCTWTFDKSYFVLKFTGKMRTANTATPVSCEPAQSKCAWTCHKSHFYVDFFKGKCRTLRIPPRMKAGP